MKTNLEVKVLIGPPGSGKSTWALEHIRKNKNWVIVSRDNFRFSLRNEPVCEPGVENLITNLVELTTIKALLAKKNVILDATHVKRKYIDWAIDAFSTYANIDYLMFDVPKEVCIARDEAREKKVGKAVIERMYEDFESLKSTFHYKPIMKRERKQNVPFFPDLSAPVPEKPYCFIFDIDGTLAIMGTRSPYDTEKVIEDLLNPVVANMLHLLHKQGFKIVLLSGRSEESREATTAWALKYRLPISDLFMRSAGDFRKDSIIKEELLTNMVLPKYTPIAVFDDRIQVVEMWASLGLFCFNVNQGNIEF